MMCSQNNNTTSSEKVYQNAEGVLVQIPTRSRRGRKSSRKSSHPLRDIRLSRSMTLEELSYISELSPSYLSRLESGTRRLNVDTIDRLSKALQCNPSDLLVTGERWGQIQAGVYAAPRPQALGSQKTTEHFASTQTVPIYSIFDNGTINFSMSLGSTTCPMDLRGIPGGFALKIADNNVMTPRYRNGDLIFIHPGRPLSPNSSAILITIDHKVIVGEFVAWRLISEVTDFYKMPFGINTTDTNDQYAIEFKQYNPVANDPYHTESIILHPQYVLSTARIIGMVEN